MKDKCWQDIKKRKEIPRHLWECKLVQSLRDNDSGVLQNSKNTAAVLATYPPKYVFKRTHGIWQGDTCTPVFTASLFTVALLWMNR